MDRKFLLLLINSNKSFEVIVSPEFKIKAASSIPELIK